MKKSELKQIIREVLIEQYPTFEEDESFKTTKDITPFNDVYIKNRFNDLLKTRPIKTEKFYKDLTQSRYEENCEIINTYADGWSMDITFSLDYKRKDISQPKDTAPVTEYIVNDISVESVVLHNGEEDFNVELSNDVKYKTIMFIFDEIGFDKGTMSFVNGVKRLK